MGLDWTQEFGRTRVGATASKDTMDLTYLGESGFQLRGREATAIVDPAPRPGQRLNAKVVLLSTYSLEPDYEDSDAFTVSRPGEYEVSGILIRGIRTRRASTESEQHAVPDPGGMAYTMTIDGVSICHLGYLKRALTAAEAEELGEAEVLLLPVGGPEALSPSLAAQMVTQLSPKIVVPMLWDGEIETTVTTTPASTVESVGEEAGTGDAEGSGEAEQPAETVSVSVPSLEPFLKELGIRNLASQERLSVTPTNQPAALQVVLLTPRPMGR